MVNIYIRIKKLINNSDEENTKKNHKRVVSVYVIYTFILIYINFNFDFLGLDNVYF
jgi:hypothetical protein